MISNLLPTIITATIALVIVVKCTSLVDNYSEYRIEKTQKKKREKAAKEAAKVREKDLERINDLKTRELSIEEKHKLLQGIGTK